MKTSFELKHRLVHFNNGLYYLIFMCRDNSDKGWTIYYAAHILVINNDITFIYAEIILLRIMCGLCFSQRRYN